MHILIHTLNSISMHKVSLRELLNKFLRILNRIFIVILRLLRFFPLFLFSIHLFVVRCSFQFKIVEQEKKEEEWFISKLNQYKNC